MIFLKYIIITSVIVFAIAVYPIFISSGENTVPFLTGYAIALFNVLLGYALIEYTVDKSMKSFMILVFGGMIIRMILVIALIVIIYYTTSLNIISTILSVMFFYFLFAAIEIYYLNKRKPNQQPKLKSI